jgi:uroporphyrinogen decarboxylase
MADLVDCGWDAIHSFEDKIHPVWEFKKEWDDKLGILGGFDMHKIETFNEEQVRAHTRLLIEKCGTKGFALGTGNSVAPTVPVDNFLAMVDEAFKAW